MIKGLGLDIYVTFPSKLVQLPEYELYQDAWMLDCTTWFTQECEVFQYDICMSSSLVLHLFFLWNRFLIIMVGT